MGLRKMTRVLGAVALACVAVGILFESGALAPVMSAFLLLNAVLLFGALVWS